MAVLPAWADKGDLKALILMPGAVIEAHAEEEKNCSVCHSTFDKSAQDALCLDCHEQLAADRQDKTGFHGLSPNAADTSCKACHQEHKGRDFNSVPLDKDTFDHQYTDFPLLGKHSPVQCEGCHQADTLLREAPGDCQDCHAKQSPHGESLGEQCADCHDSEGWALGSGFDHDTADFSLQGEHQSLSCGQCHAGQHYQFESTECVDCHQVRDVHRGLYGESCDSCHSQDSWTEAKFDHSTETEFELTGAHADQSCTACHIPGITLEAPSSDCASCHSANDVHGGRHGESCDGCHTTAEWDDTEFDHAAQTEWPLRGKHQELSCLQCHRGALDDKVASDCIDCHRSDDVHQSKRYRGCEQCHSSESWGKITGFDHELSAFPLEGMHAVEPCMGCHQDQQFHRTELHCAGCHDNDDPHQGALGGQCEDCHTPNGWSLWSFDHSGTDFELSGAHAELSCDSCHLGEGAEDVSDTCVGCHASDDRHEGAFGNNCQRCHSSESFGDVQWPN